MKFKEPRLLFICLMAFIGMIILAIESLKSGDTTRLIITLVMSLMAISMIVGRFNMMIKDDYIVVYVFRMIGILPVLVDFKDIVKIEKTSKYKLAITTKKEKLKVYILNPDMFIDTLKTEAKKLEIEIG